MRGGTIFYSSVLQPSLSSQRLIRCPLSTMLTSDVSEGGERVPNSGLVKFSQNLGLKRKYMLYIPLSVTQSFLPSPPLFGGYFSIFYQTQS